jgi:hypothetical protein
VEPLLPERQHFLELETTDDNRSDPHFSDSPAQLAHYRYLIINFDVNFERFPFGG